MDIFRLPFHLRRALLTHTTIQVQLRAPVSLSSRIIARSAVPKDIASKKYYPLEPVTLNSYAISEAPSELQLKYASKFFLTGDEPRILYSAEHFRSVPPSQFPEVAFLGRSNVGKSSLLNALFGRTKAKVAHVSKKPGRTRTMNGFGVTGGRRYGIGEDKESAWRRFPPGGLVVVDMPGYGAGSREAWGIETMKFLEQRKQLRRTFVLLDAEHGLKKSDAQLLLYLRSMGISHQIVLSKVDKLFWVGSRGPNKQRVHTGILKIQASCHRIREALDEQADDGRNAVGDILCCSSEKSLEPGGYNKIGINSLRWAILSACGMESDAAGQKRQTISDQVNGASSPRGMQNRIE